MAIVMWSDEDQPQSKLMSSCCCWTCQQQAYRKLQSWSKLWGKAWQMQYACFAHGAFAVSDLDVPPDNQIVDLKSL